MKKKEEPVIEDEKRKDKLQTILKRLLNENEDLLAELGDI